METYEECLDIISKYPDVDNNKLEQAFINAMLHIVFAASQHDAKYLESDKIIILSNLHHYRKGLNHGYLDAKGDNNENL